MWARKAARPSLRKDILQASHNTSSSSEEFGIEEG
jgi:hypothetical protein